MCSFIGTFLLFFLFLSILVYLKAGAVARGFLIAVAFIVFWPNFKSTYRLYRSTKDIITARSDAETAEDRSEQAKTSECIYYVEQTYRVSRPTARFCWFMFCFEVAAFFVYPLIALFAVDNYPLGVQFFVFAGLTGLRYYVNAAVVLEETGHMNLVDGKDENDLWKNQSRLNEIVGNITTGRSLGAWISVLGSIGFIFLALMLGAVGTDQEDLASTDDTPRVYLIDFEYVQKDSLRYPSCQLTNEYVYRVLPVLLLRILLTGIVLISSAVSETVL
jgi:hypothetical protein